MSLSTNFHSCIPFSIDKMRKQKSNSYFGLLSNQSQGDFEEKLLSVQNSIFFNFSFDKGRLKSIVSWFLEKYGQYKTIQFLERLKEFGFGYATLAGLSLGIDDLKVPNQKVSFLAEAETKVSKDLLEYRNAKITGIERMQRLIYVWNQTNDTLKQEVIKYFETTDLFNPIYMMAFSGARGNMSQVRQLVGMRGLMSDPQGQIIDFPIQSNFREGLTLTEYLISTYGARKGIVDTALRTATAGYLTRRLVDVAQHVIVSQFDCGTMRGIFLFDMKEANKTIYSFQNRLIGRVLAQNIFSFFPLEKNSNIKIEKNKENSQKTQIAKRNQEIDSILALAISKVTKKAFVRSPLTCETSRLICQLCYGWSLSYGKLVSVGEAVGVVAAQSIGEPGTQLTMRTFHTGGVFAGGLTDQILAPFDGKIQFFHSIPGSCIRTSLSEIAFFTKMPGSFFVQKSHSPANALAMLLRMPIPSPFACPSPTGMGRDMREGNGEPNRRFGQGEPNLRFGEEKGEPNRRFREGQGQREPNGRFGEGKGKFPLQINILKTDEQFSILQKQWKLQNKNSNFSELFKIPAYAILFVRNNEFVRKKQLLAQFSTVTKKQYQYGSAEQTLYSTLAGEFYLGGSTPFLAVQNNLKVSSFDSSSFISNLFIQNGNQTKIKKNKTQNHNAHFHFSSGINPQGKINLIVEKRKSHSGDLSEIELKNDLLWKSKNWTNIWILSGNIFPNFSLKEIVIQEGDVIKTTSVLNRILWKKITKFIYFSFSQKKNLQTQKKINTMFYLKALENYKTSLNLGSFHNLNSSFFPLIFLPAQQIKKAFIFSLPFSDFFQNQNNNDQKNRKQLFNNSKIKKIKKKNEFIKINISKNFTNFLNWKTLLKKFPFFSVSSFYLRSRSQKNSLLKSGGGENIFHFFKKQRHRKWWNPKKVIIFSTNLQKFFSFLKKTTKLKRKNQLFSLTKKKYAHQLLFKFATVNKNSLYLDMYIYSKIVKTSKKFLKKSNLLKFSRKNFVFYTFPFDNKFFKKKIKENISKIDKTKLQNQTGVFTLKKSSVLDFHLFSQDASYVSLSKFSKLTNSKFLFQTFVQNKKQNHVLLKKITKNIFSFFFFFNNRKKSKIEDISKDTNQKNILLKKCLLSFQFEKIRYNQFGYISFFSNFSKNRSLQLNNSNCLQTVTTLKQNQLNFLQTRNPGKNQKSFFLANKNFIGNDFPTFLSYYFPKYYQTNTNGIFTIIFFKQKSKKNYFQKFLCSKGNFLTFISSSTKKNFPLFLTNGKKKFQNPAEAYSFFRNDQNSKSVDVSGQNLQHFPNFRFADVLKSSSFFKKRKDSKKGKLNLQKTVFFFKIATFDFFHSRLKFIPNFSYFLSKRQNIVKYKFCNNSLNTKSQNVEPFCFNQFLNCQQIKFSQKNFFTLFKPFFVSHLSVNFLSSPKSLFSSQLFSSKFSTNFYIVSKFRRNSLSNQQNSQTFQYFDLYTEEIFWIPQENYTISTVQFVQQFNKEKQLVKKQYQFKIFFNKNPLFYLTNRQGQKKPFFPNLQGISRWASFSSFQNLQNINTKKSFSSQKNFKIQKFNYIQQKLTFYKKNFEFFKTKNKKAFSIFPRSFSTVPRKIQKKLKTQNFKKFFLKNYSLKFLKIHLNFFNMKNQIRFDFLSCPYPWNKKKKKRIFFPISFVKKSHTEFRHKNKLNRKIKRKIIEKQKKVNKNFQNHFLLKFLNKKEKKNFQNIQKIFLNEFKNFNLSSRQKSQARFAKKISNQCFTCLPFQKFSPLKLCLSQSPIPMYMPMHMPMPMPMPFGQGQGQVQGQGQACPSPPLSHARWASERGTGKGNQIEDLGKNKGKGMGKGMGKSKVEDKTFSNLPLAVSRSGVKNKNWFNFSKQNFSLLKKKKKIFLESKEIKIKIQSGWIYFLPNSVSTFDFHQKISNQSHFWKTDLSFEQNKILSETIVLNNNSFPFNTINKHCLSRPLIVPPRMPIAIPIPMSFGEGEGELNPRFGTKSKIWGRTRGTKSKIWDGNWAEAVKKGKKGKKGKQAFSSSQSFFFYSLPVTKKEIEKKEKQKIQKYFFLQTFHQNAQCRFSSQGALYAIQKFSNTKKIQNEKRTSSKNGIILKQLNFVFQKEKLAIFFRPLQYKLLENPQNYKNFFQKLMRRSFNNEYCSIFGFSCCKLFQNYHSPIFNIQNKSKIFLQNNMHFDFQLWSEFQKIQFQNQIQKNSLRKKMMFQKKLKSNQSFYESRFHKKEMIKNFSSLKYYLQKTRFQKFQNILNRENFLISPQKYNQRKNVSLSPLNSENFFLAQKKLVGNKLKNFETNVAKKSFFHGFSKNFQKQNKHCSYFFSFYPMQFLPIGISLFFSWNKINSNFHNISQSQKSTTLVVNSLENKMDFCICQKKAPFLNQRFFSFDFFQKSSFCSSFWLNKDGLHFDYSLSPFFFQHRSQKKFKKAKFSSLDWTFLRNMKTITTFISQKKNPLLKLVKKTKLKFSRKRSTILKSKQTLLQNYFFKNNPNFYANTKFFSPYEGEVISMVTNEANWWKKASEISTIQKFDKLFTILTRKDLFCIKFPSFENIKQTSFLNDQSNTGDFSSSPVFQYKDQSIENFDFLFSNFSKDKNSFLLNQTKQLTYSLQNKQKHLLGLYEIVFKIQKTSIFSTNFENDLRTKYQIFLMNKKNLEKNKAEMSSFVTKYNKKLYKFRNLRIGYANLSKKPILGTFFIYGDCIFNNAIRKPGQIIHVNRLKMTLRKGQPFLISPKGILHFLNIPYIKKNLPILTLPYQTVQSGDIVQGIPKVEQYFEARTTIQGRLFVSSLPILLKGIFGRYKSILPLEQATRQSFLKIQQIVVDGVQRVYRSQGVSITDKHLEVVVRQMTTKVQIIHGAQTGFFPGELVNLDLVERINKFLMVKIRYEPVILGITRASLEVESFLSASSFQQTTKILALASISRKKDFLKGLKENLLVGNLIPSGTGYLLLYKNFSKF